MKKYIKFLNIFLLTMFLSCSSININAQKDIFLTDFFNKESVYESLIDYYPNKSITIYDKENVLIQNSKEYGINDKIINIVTEKPKNKEYFVVYSFTLNKNLAMIVLNTSDMDYGIVYYLRKKQENERWAIMNIIPKNSR
ncbi:hypothetical protein [Chryseobacterium wanjuense]